MAKILIIEDTENNRVLLTRRLKSKGYDIVTAESAEKGLSMIETERPGLILMDVGLPGMDGWEATPTLKSPGHETYSGDCPHRARDAK